MFGLMVTQDNKKDAWKKKKQKKKQVAKSPGYKREQKPNFSCG